MKKKKSRKKTHANVTVTVVRDRKIRTAQRTKQIVGFVTVPTWKKIRSNILIWDFAFTFRLHDKFLYSKPTMLVFLLVRNNFCNFFMLSVCTAFSRVETKQHSTHAFYTYFATTRQSEDYFVLFLQ